MMTIRKVLVATAAFAGLSVTAGAAGAAGAVCNINTIMAVGHPDLAQYLLGPNAARVVRHATCSVLVVRQPQPAQDASFRAEGP